MKKIIFALTFVAFTGSMFTTVYAACTGSKIEICKDDKKKRRKKGSCSAEKTTSGSSCSKGAEGKSCCSKKH